MQNEPNFQKSQVFITSRKTSNYGEKHTLDTWLKQTQTNPILKPPRRLSGDKAKPPMLKNSIGGA